MRLSTLAVTLLASLLSLSAHATSIPADSNWQPSLAPSIALEPDLAVAGSTPFVPDFGYEPANTMAADAVVAETGGGYRFSRFVAFHAVTRFCLETRNDQPGSCYPVDNPRSVPEPGTMLLLGTGLLLLALGRRRRGPLSHA